MLDPPRNPLPTLPAHGIFDQALETILDGGRLPAANEDMPSGVNGFDPWSLSIIGYLLCNSSDFAWSGGFGLVAARIDRHRRADQLRRRHGIW